MSSGKNIPYRLSYPEVEGVGLGGPLLLPQKHKVWHLRRRFAAVLIIRSLHIHCVTRGGWERLCRPRPSLHLYAGLIFRARVEWPGLEVKTNSALQLVPEVRSRGHRSQGCGRHDGQDWTAVFVAVRCRRQRFVVALLLLIWSGTGQCWSNWKARSDALELLNGIHDKRSQAQMVPRLAFCWFCIFLIHLGTTYSKPGQGIHNVERSKTDRSIVWEIHWVREQFVRVVSEWAREEGTK